MKISEREAWWLYEACCNMAYDDDHIALSPSADEMRDELRRSAVNHPALAADLRALAEKVGGKDWLQTLRRAIQEPWDQSNREIAARADSGDAASTGQMRPEMTGNLPF